MLERHKKRLDEIAHRNSKLKIQTISPVMGGADSEMLKRNEKKKILHEIF